MHAIGNFTIDVTAVTTATVTKILNANRNRRCLIIDNGANTADEMFVTYGDQPTDTDNMHRIAPEGMIIWDNQAIPTGDVWVYHAKGSNMNIKVGEGH